MEDVVVDTNIFLHAQNPNEQRFDDSVDFVDELRTAETTLCIDPGFYPDDRNRSLIGREYLDNLRFGSVGYSLLVGLLSQERVKDVSTSVPPQVRRQVRALVGKARDRTFLIVAINSDEQVLVSHDYEDFPDKCRAQIKSKFSVEVIEAGVGAGRL